jgi:hypothetical protein
MGKLPASLFYWGDFVRDPDLRRCTNAEVGVWIRCLCLMFEAEQRGILATNGIAWTNEEVALAVGGNTDETIKCVTSLVTKGVASRNELGALMNRRMYRDEKIRVDTKIRVQRFREKQNSNDGSNDESNGNVRQCTEAVYETEALPSLSFKRIDADSIYGAYPRKVGRGAAIRAIKSSIEKVRKGNRVRAGCSADEAADFLLERVTAYAESAAGERPSGDDYRPHPATWFNHERYFDDPEQWNLKRNGGSNGHTANGFDALDEHIRRKELEENPNSHGGEPAAKAIGETGGPGHSGRLGDDAGTFQW